jgi:hypothetical protein
MSEIDTRRLRGALIIAGAFGIAVGIRLGRVAHLVGGGICAWIGVSLLAPSPER